jgi:release factor glutamine methyltransferase
MTIFTIENILHYMHREIDLLYPKAEVDAMINQIFKHKLKFSRADIYLKSKTNVPKSMVVEIENIISELKKFRPLQYILGETSFYGLIFQVNEHVLIPRPETEELVEWVLMEHGNEKLKTIDLGTGSGCIPVSLAKNRNNWEVYALDISADALQLASENAIVNNVKVQFLLGDILDISTALLDLKFDLIVSNPPYVTMAQKEEMLPNVLNYEPHLALFAPENDPLIFYKKIAIFGKECLKRGGSIYVEINEAFPEQTKAIFQHVGFEVILKKDIHEKYRMIKAYIPIL